MKRFATIIGTGIFAVISAVSCGNSTDKAVREELRRTNEKLTEILDALNEFERNQTVDKLAAMCEMTEDDALRINTVGLELNEEQQRLLNEQREKISRTRKQMADLKDAYIRTMFKVIEQKEMLVEEMQVFPMYLKKGTSLILKYGCNGQSTVNLFNADAKKLVRTYKKNEFRDSIFIQNTAVYLLELNVVTPEYCNVEILQRVNSLDEFKKVYKFQKEDVECTSGGFRVKKIPGIDIKPIFEEPHKYTLRSQLKNLWDNSSPCRSVAALKIPSGASDILYHLRISTDDDGKSGDGDFCNDVTSKYKKIKLLGLPLYESTTNKSNIFRELLSGLNVKREEKAYCNLYVFSSSKEAKRFQDNVKLEKLSYDMDYSAPGTQSRNERIPTKGYTTIYLGFENSRQTHDVYLWLEALATVPKSVYFTETYTVTNAE